MTSTRGIGFAAMFLVSSVQLAQAQNAGNAIDEANSRFKLKDYRGAIELYTKAIQQDRKNASVYMLRGVSKQALDDNLGALQDYDKAIDLDSSKAIAFYSRAAVKKEFANLSDPKVLGELISDYSKALSLDSTFTQAYLERGVANSILGNKTEACQDFKNAARKGNSQGVDLLNKFCPKVYLDEKLGELDPIEGIWNVSVLGVCPGNL